MVADLEHIDVSEHAGCHERVQHIGFGIACQQRYETATFHAHDDARRVVGGVRYRRDGRHHDESHAADAHHRTRRHLDYVAPRHGARLIDCR